MLPLRCMDETMCSSQHLMGPDCVWLQLPGGDLQPESLNAQSLSCKKGCLVKVLKKESVQSQITASWCQMPCAPVRRSTGRTAGPHPYLWRPAQSDPPCLCM